MTQYGMQTFDQSVLGLMREGVITEEEALKNCNNPNELSLKLKGISGTSDRTWKAMDIAETEPGPLSRGVGSAGGRPGISDLI
jgi:twitching motility protein PilT